MEFIVYKGIVHSGICLGLLTLAGCPLINGFLEPPDAAFEGAPATGEAPLTVLFVDASAAGTANITAWQWDFGDGMTSTSRNPTHIYQTPGLYAVSLTVTTDVGTDTELKRDYVRVVEAPAADFTAAPVEGSAPLSVAFTDTSTPGSSPITAWEWNFGDRTPTSPQQSPTHVYTAPGIYTVTLTVTTEVGVNTATRTQLINVAGSPVADFTSDFAPGVAPLTVSFTDTSEVGTATITGWTWDFGDGTMAAEQNPTHVYTAPGAYTVSLAIQTTAGNAVAVRPDLIVVDEGPTAAFDGTPVMGSAPLTVSFTDTSAPGSQEITARLWDFGDGGLLSTLRNPTRVYQDPGVYTVSLRVTTAAGSNTAEKPGYITVAPGVAFTASQTQGQGNLTVQFVDQSAVGDLAVSAWAWDFGDGGMSAEENPEHTYTEPGVYDVSLSITTELGSSSATQTGLIVVEPAAAFSAEPESGPPPLEVKFTDETAAGTLEISAWAWDFGDGGTGTEQNPMHTYDTPGAYTVSLAATTPLGESVAEKTGFIAVEPVVDFNANQQSGQGSLSVQFEDTSNAGNLNVLGWFWEFGDGATSTDPNPSHHYVAIGSYDVTLTLTTALGDHEQIKAGFIQVQPFVDFKADVVQGAEELTVTFTDQTDAGSLEIEGWSWAFGDGMVSDEQNPVHVYTPGLYTVGLTVTTSQGDAVTVKEDLILVTPAVTLGFVQPSGPAPFEASLLDLTEVGTFEVQGWRWELGDGNTSEEQNPTHTYEEPGKYTVTLTLITNGGEFSKTEPDFITALRGPTAAFSHTAVRGGSPTDPVTVSFLNMSLAGDSPILNQTWEFGESAIADEELAMEASPTVMYPGLAFDTIPQDVSLTVRTFIAANTLLRENLFEAPVAPAAVAPGTLAGIEFSAVSADASGAVWAAGRAPGQGGENPVLICFGPDGLQRWGVALETGGALALDALHAAGDGSVAAAGTWTSKGGSRVYIARFDVTGALLWECDYAEGLACAATGIAGRADGMLAVTGRPETATGVEAPLFLLTCDRDGAHLARYETGLRTMSSAAPIIARDDGAMLAGVVNGGQGLISLVRSYPDSGNNRGVDLPSVPVPGYPRAIYRDAGTGTLLAVLDLGDRAAVVAASEGEAPIELLSLPAGAPAGLVASDGGVDVVWLARDGGSGTWAVRRARVLP